MFNNKENSSSCIETLIGEQCSIVGTLNGNGLLKVDGMIDGDILWQDDILIGENSCCTGNISCTNASIGGKLKGNIICDSTLTIENSGIVEGDITVKNLTIMQGGILDGKCTMIVPKTAADVLE